tara:strand:+ start:519 stop:641 length:123 start_codon:yes stop_codon:yes gene_type:complete
MILPYRNLPVENKNVVTSTQFGVVIWTLIEDLKQKCFHDG